MKKPIEIWHLFSPTLKVVLIAGIFSLAGAFISAFLRPSTGRYVMVDYKHPSYDIFDTASGKVYIWRGTSGLVMVDDPINNKVIGVINREHREILPSSNKMAK